MHPAMLCDGEHTTGVPLASHGVPDAEQVSLGIEKAKQAERQEIAAHGGIEDPSSPHGAWSPSARRKELGTATVDLLWFEAKVGREAEVDMERKGNYLDFWKKYQDEEPEINLGTPSYTWGLIFDLPPSDEVKYAMDDEGGSAERQAELRAKFDDGLAPQFMCAECVELVSRFWAADLSCKMTRSTNGKEVHVSVGASYEILVDEANFLRPNMRLINTKGTARFQSDKLSHYMPSVFDEPERATCFSSALQQQLVVSRMERLAGVHLDERVNFLDRDEGMELIKNDIEHGRTILANRVRELLSTHGAYRPGGEKIFGAEVITLGKQSIADPHFQCKPPHNLSRTEQAALKAEEQHMMQVGLHAMKYEEIERAVQVLSEWTSKSPGKEEAFTGSLTSYFPLHHAGEVAYLRHNWGSFRLLLQPVIKGKSPEGRDTENYFRTPLSDKHPSLFWLPIDTIRDYFGDHVGLYAEWLGVYSRSLVYPALSGAMIQGYQMYQDDVTVDNNMLMIPYSVYLCVWSAMFNVRWLRRQNELQFLWGSENVEQQAPIRAEFKGILVIDEVSGAEEMAYYSLCARVTRLMLSTFVSLLCVLVVIVSAFTATTVRYIDAPHPNDIYCQEYLAGPDSNLANGTLDNIDEIIDGILVTRHVDGQQIVRSFDNFTAIVKVEGIDTQEDCRSWAEGNTTEFEALVDGVMVTHHVDANMIVHTTWIDGWEAGTTDFDKKKWEYLSAALNTAFIVIFGMLYESIAVMMTDWENHRTQIEYDNQLILKNFGFQFVNNYFVLFYIGYMRQLDTQPLCDFIGADVCPEVAVTECKNGTCLGQVQTNVIAVFTVKTVIAQTRELLLPYFKAATNKTKNILGVVRLQDAVHDATATAMQKMMMPDQVQNMLNLDDESVAHSKKEREFREEMALRMANHLNADTTEATEIEKQSYLLEYDSTFDDFNEMAIQFGYLALFSPVYPLAPLMALANNILEIRIDAAKLCSVCRRPEWRPQADIGSWFTVMNLIGFAAVMTNATMITFVGKLLANTDEMRDGGLNARVKSPHLWVVSVGMEHALFLLRVIVLTVVPHTPSWITTVRNRLQWFENQAKPGHQIRAEQGLQRALEAELEQADSNNNSDGPAREVIQAKTRNANIHLHMKARRYGKKLQPDSLVGVDQNAEPESGIDPGLAIPAPEPQAKGKQNEQAKGTADARSGMVKVTNPLQLSDGSDEDETE
eukprot:COSAG02_NODE_3139_length_7297_cov_371.401223_3_plen_1215_part_00